jgi:hypothetical protein
MDTISVLRGRLRNQLRGHDTSIETYFAVKFILIENLPQSRVERAFEEAREG